MPESTFQRIFNSTSQALNRIVPWHKLPRSIALVVLYGLRDRLRRLNLHDSNGLESKNMSQPPPLEPGFIVNRAPDGTYNDLSKPAMGAAGTRFGRNFPLDQVYPDEASIMTPNPRTVSLELLTRDEFQPATTLNLLAAAWIQFMVHDWFSHGKNDPDHFFDVPLAAEDPWPVRPMRISKTQPDLTRVPNAKDGPPTFNNQTTHWWDGSQIYGADRESELRLRSERDGKLKIGDGGLLPLDSDGNEDAGVNGNWWIGLSMLHTLFVREHNLICDRLRAVYPTWTDQDLYLRARLINAAVLAKIHTVEWTPAILGHPTIQFSMKGGWWGIAGKHITEALGRFGKGDILTGIPGSETDQFSAPYAMTEEFVSVYRMHGLIPDEFKFRSAVPDGKVYDNKTLPDVSGQATRKIMTSVAFSDLFYSFGTSYPGALVLHNFPKFLQKLKKKDEIMDLAAIDILRDRERGVPRYNRFRQLLHMPKVKTFEEITDNPKWAAELRRIYNNDVNSVDLMVGLLAESPRPAGFGFSETAFRVFLVMAPRRLKSDRFFTVDYTPQVYTQTGLDWIRDSDFTTILIRHMPALQPALAHLANPFSPWPRMKKT